MSTRAQIAIQIDPEEWAHVYVHFDGYPAHMLPALARWKPEDILTAREIRQVTAEALGLLLVFLMKIDGLKEERRAVELHGVGVGSG